MNQTPTNSLGVPGNKVTVDYILYYSILGILDESDTLAGSDCETAPNKKIWS